MKISDTRLKNFRRAVEDRGLRLADVAELLGKAPAQISSFGGKNPTKGIGDKIARQIEQALQLPVGALDDIRGSDYPRDGACRDAVERLPVLSPSAAAEWQLADNRMEKVAVTEWLKSPSPVSVGSYVLSVEGMSMEPAFHDGDKVVIDPYADKPPGGFVAVMLHGSSTVVLRQLVHENEIQYLIANNPHWPNRIVPAASWTICGHAIWKLSKL